MKKSFLFGSFTAVAFAALSLPSCGLVDVENFDIENLNTESTVLKGTEIKVFEEDKVYTLGDFIKPDNSGGVISVTSEGNYKISYTLEPQSLGDGFTIDADKFAINAGDSFNAGISLDTVIPEGTPISYNEADEELIKSKYPNIDFEFFKNSLSQVFSFEQTIDFSISDFPALISAFKKADLKEGSKITFNLVPSGIPFNKFVFKAGTKIEFPAFLVFSSCSNKDFTLKDGHVLEANKDVNVVLGNGLAFELALQSISMGENGVSTASGLDLSGKVLVNGTVEIDPAEFNGPRETLDLAKEYPALVAAGLIQDDGTHVVVRTVGEQSLNNFAVNCSYAAVGVTIESASIKLSTDALPSFQDSFGFDINGLPDFFSEAEATIELSDVQVNMIVESTLPFQFGINAKLSTLLKGATQHAYTLGPLWFAPNATTKYSLGEKPDGVEGDVIYKNIAGLGQILNPIPDRVEASSFEILFNENEWITIGAGTYTGSFGVGVEAPIAFTANTKLSLGMTEDVDISLPAEVGDYLKGETVAQLKFQAVNTIPLNVDLSLTVLDADKKAIEGVKIEFNKTPAITAGTLENPATSDVVLTITLPEGSKLFKSLELQMKASSDSNVAGIPLNKDQSITLKNVVVALPNGITTDVKEIVNK